jgi:hypothetical protein
LPQGDAAAVQGIGGDDGERLGIKCAAAAVVAGECMDLVYHDRATTP